MLSLTFRLSPQFCLLHSESNKHQLGALDARKRIVKMPSVNRLKFKPKILKPDKGKYNERKYAVDRDSNLGLHQLHSDFCVDAPVLGIASMLRWMVAYGPSESGMASRESLNYFSFDTANSSPLTAPVAATPFFIAGAATPRAFIKPLDSMPSFKAD